MQGPARQAPCSGGFQPALHHLVLAMTSVARPGVTAPTLVLHTRRDRRAPLDQGRLLASLIPDARLVLLDSSNHILQEDEPAWRRFLDEVNAFLA